MLERLDTVIAFAVMMLGISLLITVLVQMVGTFFGLRGTNLRWGLIQLISTVHPPLAGEAQNIANRVLRHPIISDSTMSRFNNFLSKVPIANRWTLATTIRVDELIGILRSLGDLAGNPTEAAMATIAGAARTAVAPEVRAAAEQVRGILAALPAPPGVAPAASPALQIDKLLEKIPTKVEAGFDDLKSWFDAAMDRASQRFTLHTRAWTVVFAFLVAFVLHLDGFRFLSELSSNPDMRASLVASADAMAKNADAILAQQRNAATQATPAGATQPTPASAAKSHVPQAYQNAMSALASKNKLLQAALTAEKPYFASREEGIEWMRKALQGDAQTDDLIKEYETAVDNELTSQDDKMLDRAASIRGILNHAKFQLIPDPYHSWDFFPWSPAPFSVGKLYHVSLWKNLHFWGILFSSALLTLGAPFWFNALKNLSALRPIVAGKQDKEQKQD
jgi:hypothetical protein